MQPHRAAKKSMIDNLVLAAIVGSIFAITNLPYRYVEVGGISVGESEFSALGGARYDNMPVMAGWPLRFWITSDTEGLSRLRYWSPLYLSINVVTGLALTCSVFQFIRIRTRRINQSPSPAKTKTLFDLSIAAVMVLIPASLFAASYVTTVHHRKVADRIAERGICSLTCWFPKPIADHIPGGLFPLFSKIRYVQCIGADASLIRDVCELPTLVKLECHFSKLRRDSLVTLFDHPFLTGLALNRQEIGREEVDAIAQLRWLTELSFYLTNLDNPLLSRLNTMQGLRLMNLSQCNIKLSELGSPAWSATVIDLRLSRPTRGNSDSIVIESWPRLERLSISRPLSISNNAILDIRLVDLPQLHTLSLDRLQKHNLHANNLPRLARISDEVMPTIFLMENSIWLPGLSWFANLHLENMASLVDVGCFARDLEQFQILNAPQLRSFELGAYLLSSTGGQVLISIDAQRCQQWVDQLGSLQGPAKVALFGLPLQSVDLSPLAKNQRIRDLRIQQSVVSFDQVKSLAELRGLSNIDLEFCNVESDQLTWMLNQFPKLSSLKVDGGKLSNLDLAGRDNLKFIETNTLHRVERVHIVDQPNLTASFRLDRAPEHLEIREAHHLRGLVVAEPWPRDSVLSGLRDLKWFAAGGGNVNDAVLDQLLACPGLDQLTLAYPKLSRNQLRRIGEMKHLSVLTIPGAGVDDQITLDWRNLQSLWEINLDDNQVGAGTIAWLSRIESLRSVSLSRVELDGAAIESLSELGQLSSLRLSEVELPAGCLTTLLQNDTLEHLDISGTVIGSELIDDLSRSTSLRLLNLRNCKVSQDDIRRLIVANDGLSIDVEISDEDPLTSKSLVNGLPDLDSPLRDEIQDRMGRYRSPSTLNHVESNKITNRILPIEDPMTADVDLGDPKLSKVGARILQFLPTVDVARIDLDRMRELVQLASLSSVEAGAVGEPISKSDR